MADRSRKKTYMLPTAGCRSAHRAGFVQSEVGSVCGLLSETAVHSALVPLESNLDRVAPGGGCSSDPDPAGVIEVSSISHGQSPELSVTAHSTTSSSSTGIPSPGSLQDRAARRREAGLAASQRPRDRPPTEPFARRVEMALNRIEYALLHGAPGEVGKVARAFDIDPVGLLVCIDENQHGEWDRSVIREWKKIGKA